MTTILLIRHGENDYVKKGRLAGRLPGIHLNPTGQRQAQSLAERLKDAPIQALFSSPLERAIETAQPIADSLGIQVVLRPGLLETDVGEWSGEKLKGLSRLKLWRVVQYAPSAMNFPGGESFLTTQTRIVQELLDLSRQYEPQDMIICVSHADPIRLAVAYFIGLPLDMFQRLIVSPGSITVLQLGEMGGRLLALNFEPGFSLRKS